MDKLVILESPWAGDIERNEWYAHACMLDCIKRGEAPFASHLLYTLVLDEDNPDERKQGIELGHEWMKAADKVVVYTDLGISEGMKKGIDRAITLGIPFEFRKIMI